jgi:predicted house-cleaning noncanonical NTP pyrophosphatase (MazG superfamily)
MNKIYNKVVRDKIPEIIMAQGNSCEYRRLNDDDFLFYLEKKLTEELQEYQESHKIEELVDILEIVYRIVELRGVSETQVSMLRKMKNEERGALRENLFLIKVEEGV